AFGSARIGEDADVRRVFCLQKVDDLSPGRNGGPPPVHPDGVPVPGGRLMQRARETAIVADGDRHDVPRKITEGAETVQLVRVPCEADDRSRSFPEQTD